MTDAWSGKAIAKRGELLETLNSYLEEHDNQQPSLSRNTLEGSTTNSQLLTGEAEESNGDTSALHLTLVK